MLEELGGRKANWKIKRWTTKWIFEVANSKKFGRNNSIQQHKINKIYSIVMGPRAGQDDKRLWKSLLKKWKGKSMIRECWGVSEGSAMTDMLMVMMTSKNYDWNWQVGEENELEFYIISM